MLVYKYRSDEDLQRDIKSLKNNTFFASSKKHLNDPFEFQIISDRIQNLIEKLDLSLETKSLKDNFDSILTMTHEVGVYSLSKRKNNNTMWAHYANAHKGYCIEYDFNLLKDKYNPLDLNFELHVDYRNAVPEIILNDFTNTEVLKQKIFGSKSTEWILEDEVRLIFNS